MRDVAQTLLSRAWDTDVVLTESTALREYEGFVRVARFEVSAAGADVPATVVVKRPGNWAPYEPASGRGPARGIHNDWAALETLAGTGLAAGLYAADRESGTLVLEDLGDRSVADALLETDAAAAEHAVVAFARTLGAMHATTVGRTQDYRRTRVALSPERSEPAAAVRDGVRDFLGAMDAIGAQVSPRTRDEIDELVAMLERPGEFLALTHGDPCPDNDRITADGSVRLIDFEVAALRHALYDGCYGHVPWPTCWCTNRLPSRVERAMEDAYRGALATGVAAARDDRTFDRVLVHACGWWLLTTTARSLAVALLRGGPWGISTHHQRLALRVRQFARVAHERALLPGLAEFADDLGDLLKVRLEDMPLYPAFRG